MTETAWILWYNTLGMGQVEVVGGKNASLGEMICNLSQAGVRVPNGFATTAAAFTAFTEQNDIESRIQTAIQGLNVEDTQQLAKVGQTIRGYYLAGKFPLEMEQAIRVAYETLSGANPRAVAVRSSATAEDLPDASFAGQQETYLNVTGIDAVLQTIRQVFASLYTDRAIAYRVHQGYDRQKIALSAGVQLMVRSDLGSSGVLFTLDTESGFDDAIFITGSHGLGELVVQGAVNPDEFYVYKPSLQTGKRALLSKRLGSKHLKMIYAAPGSKERVQTIDNPEAARATFSLTDEEVEALGKLALIIEAHYKRPMDVEWAKDGEDGHLYIVQARPETVKSRANTRCLERYSLKPSASTLCEGRAIGQRIGSGTVRVVKSLSEMHLVQPGEVLVADMTDPDWEPVMKRAAAIVTNRGGRTCHAAIIARELGIPAVVGVGNATDTLLSGIEVTVSCAEGEVGKIYPGKIPFSREEIALDTMPEIPVRIMMNVANPESAFMFSRLPHQGVGLARLEFVISRDIGIHPLACLDFVGQSPDVQNAIAQRIKGYTDPVSFYVEKLTESMATLAAAFAPHPVIVRFSDFKTNEYANLIGGPRYEPHEENPMLGFRGAGRYVSSQFGRAFALECQAVRAVREQFGLKNLTVMIPFVRTVKEAEAVLKTLSMHGLTRGEDGLKVYMMCELPTNCILADDYLALFDGFSIGSNDLTQLTLGLDRDSATVAAQFDERDPAVLAMLEKAITACHKAGKYVGICGQGPSDHPDLAQWLVKQGITSLSLNPDSVVETWLKIGKG